MKPNLRPAFSLLSAGFGLPRADKAEAGGLPVISIPPVPSSLPAHTSAVLTVTASGDAPLSHQWHQGESGATASPVPGAAGRNKAIAAFITASYQKSADLKTWEPFTVTPSWSRPTPMATAWWNSSVSVRLPPTPIRIFFCGSRSRNNPPARSRPSSAP